MAFGSLLIREKQAKILLTLRDASQTWYISNLAKEANSTYVHTCNFLIGCEKEGIVVSEKHGKIKMVKLTEKGMQIADHLNGIYASMGVQNAQQKKPEERKQ